MKIRLLSSSYQPSGIMVINKQIPLLPIPLSNSFGSPGKSRVVSRYSIVNLFERFGNPADHLERNVALVAVLVLFIGIDQGAGALDYVVHVHYKYQIMMQTF